MSTNLNSSLSPKSEIPFPLSDKCSQSAFFAAKKTFENRKGKWGEAAPTLDHYYCQLLKTPTHTLAMTSDGIGTKIEIAERCAKYTTLGFDLVAMIVDDIICSGAEPTHLSNILDVDVLDSRIVDALFQGLQQAADEAGIMITGGEIAELGSRIAGYGPRMHFNWCATGIGVLPNETNPIDGSTIGVGDVVVSLRSCGLRSNGFSLARKILQKRFGDSWHLEAFDAETSWGEKLLTPCLIYTPHVLHLLRTNHTLKGIAHITGGGVPGNLERILQPWGNGAFLDNLQAPHPELMQLQEWGDISPARAFETWNMGNGMMLVLDPAEADSAIQELQKRGIPAKRAGIITNERSINIVTPTENDRIQFPYED